MLLLLFLMNFKPLTLLVVPNLLFFGFKPWCCSLILWWTSTLPLFLVLFFIWTLLLWSFLWCTSKTTVPSLSRSCFLFKPCYYCLFFYEPIFELFMIYFFGSNLDNALLLWWDLDLPPLPLPCPWSFIFEFRPCCSWSSVS